MMGRLAILSLGASTSTHQCQPMQRTATPGACHIPSSPATLRFPPLLLITPAPLSPSPPTCSCAVVRCPRASVRALPSRGCTLPAA